MTLLEIGLIKNQNLIIHQSFYKLKKVAMELNAERRSQVIKLICDLSGHVLEKKIVSLNTGDYRIFFETSSILSSRIFIYAIGDFYSDVRIVNHLLDELAKKFSKQFPEEIEDGVEDSNRFLDFKKEIDKTLRDERLTPGDRVRSFLLNPAK